MYQVMRKNDIGTLSAAGRGEAFAQSEQAVDWITNEGAANRTYVVIPLSGYPAYTVEETKARTLHKLPKLV